MIDVHRQALRPRSLNHSTSMDSPPADSNAALILSHPGHELRVLGWVEMAKPLVIILTDGSGHSVAPRIDLSREVLHEAGARIATLFGDFADRQVYEAILNQDTAFFIAIQTRITELLKSHRIDFVAGDAIEGYNPSHDLCRVLIDNSVRSLTTEFPSYEFPLIAHPAIWSEQAGALCYQLSPEKQQWKLDRITSYAQSVGGQLLTEVQEGLAKAGAGTLASEWFTPSRSTASLKDFEHSPPYYEQHGNQRVRAGLYENTIRFNEHIRPLLEALAPDRPS